MTPDDLAQEIGISAKTLRSWLRATWPPAFKHSRWDLSPEQCAAARARFATPARAAALAAPPSGVAVPVVLGQQLPTAHADGEEGWSGWIPLAEALTRAPTTPGVYMARQSSGEVVYVGMAGERRGMGIRGRLAIYVSGKGLASGLGEAVLDRALADPDWLEERLAEVRAGQPRRAKAWGQAALTWAELQIRWRSTQDRASALLLELEVMRALPQDHLWNRRR